MKKKWNTPGISEINIFTSTTQKKGGGKGNGKDGGDKPPTRTKETGNKAVMS